MCPSMETASASVPNQIQYTCESESLFCNYFGDVNFVF